MNSRRDMLFAPTRDGVPSSDDAFTAVDLISAQEAMEDEARESLPFDPTICTYALGSIRQPIYAVSPTAALCAGCSVSCAGDVELVELFARRDFQCDCGTGILPPCNIDKRRNAPRNTYNRYDQCFSNQFCKCGVPYDPLTETDEMFGCLVCENWFHSKCVLPLGPSGDPALGPDDFDALVCHACVASNRNGVRVALDRWAGVKGLGVMVVTEDGVRGELEDEEDEPLEEDDDDEDHQEEEQASSEAEGDYGSKRKASPSAGGRPKRARVVSFAPTSKAPARAGGKGCSAPPQNMTNTSLLSDLVALGQANIFLQEEYMQRWCRCVKCVPFFIDAPFLLDEEETYEPPLDTAPHKTLLELGSEALSSSFLPRERVNEAAAAFASMSERLKAFLRAEKLEKGEDHTVTKEDVDAFFSSERKA